MQKRRWGTMDDTIRARRLTEYFVAEVTGLDLTKPYGEATRSRLLDLFDTHSVLVFRGQRLTPEDQVRFSRIFGELKVHLLTEYLLPGSPEILVISNVVENGRRIGLFDTYDPDTPEWHSDYSWSSSPSSASVLYALETPPNGGDTLFASTAAAFDQLPEWQKTQIRDLRAVHSLDHLTEVQRPFNLEKPSLTAEQRRQAPDVVHPIVLDHPRTGRPSLYIGSMCIKRIVGLPETEGRDLVQALVQHATQGKFLYRHRWQPGDLIIWDNRSTLHAGPTPYDTEHHRRILHRTTLMDFENGQGVPVSQAANERPLAPRG